MTMAPATISTLDDLRRRVEGEVAAARARLSDFTSLDAMRARAEDAARRWPAFREEYFTRTRATEAARVSAAAGMGGDYGGAPSFGNPSLGDDPMADADLEAEARRVFLEQERSNREGELRKRAVDAARASLPKNEGEGTEAYMNRLARRATAITRSVGGGPVDRVPPTLGERAAIEGEYFAGPALRDAGLALMRSVPNMARQAGGALSAAGLTGVGDPILDAANTAADTLRLGGFAPSDAVLPGIVESVPSLGVTLAGALGAGAVGGPVAGVGAGALLAGAQSGGSQYADAIDRGSSESEARASALPVAAFSAITSAVPIARFVGRIAPKAFQNALTRLGSGAAGRVTMDALAEGSQEAAESAFQRVMRDIAENDPEAYRGIAQEIGASFLGGSVLGGVAGGALDVGVRTGGGDGATQTRTDAVAAEGQRAQGQPPGGADEAVPAGEAGGTGPGAGEPGGSVPRGTSGLPRDDQSVQPDERLNEVTAAVDAALDQGADPDAVISAIPDDLTDAEQEALIARVEARRTAAGEDEALREAPAPPAEDAAPPRPVADRAERVVEPRRAVPTRPEDVEQILPAEARGPVVEGASVGGEGVQGAETVPAPEAANRPQVSRTPADKPQGTPTEAKGAPRPLSASALDERIVDQARRRGLLDDTEQFEARESERRGESVAVEGGFPGPTLPADLAEALKGRPELRRLVRTNDPRGRGQDAFETLGLDEYVKALELTGVREVDRSIEALNRTGDPDPSWSVLTYARENRERGERLQAIPGEDIQPGDYFRLGGDNYGVTQRGEELVAVGPDGQSFVIARGGAVAEVVPVAQGTFRRGGDAAAQAAARRLEEGEAANESRIEAALDFFNRTAQAARDRRASRAQQPGRATGASTLIPDALDYGIELAAELAASGLTVAQALSTVPGRARALLDAAGRVDDEALLSRTESNAERLLKRSANPDGTINRRQFRQAVDAAEQRERVRAGRERTREAVKAERAKTRETREKGKQATREAKAKGRADTLEARAEGRARVKETREQARQRLQEKLADLRRRLTDKATAATQTAKGAREEVVRLVEENLAPAQRGAFIKAASKAKTLGDIAGVAKRIHRTIARGNASNSWRRLRRLDRKKRTRYLNPERQTQARKLTDEAKALVAEVRKRGIDADEMHGFSERIQEIDRLVTELHAEERAERVVQVGQRRLRSKRLRNTIGQRVGRANAWATVGSDAPAGTPQAFEARLGRRGLLRILPPASIAKRITGDLDGKGWLHRILITELRKADTRAKGRFRAALVGAEAAARKAGFKSLLDARLKISGALGPHDQQTVDVALGGSKKLTLGQAMHLFAMDPETRERFISKNAPGRFQVGDRAAGEKFSITQADFDAIAKALTPEQKAFVVAVKDLIDAQRADLFGVFRRLKGYSPREIAGYFPIMLDQEARVSEPEAWKGISEKWLEDAGFLKERTGSGGTPILVGDFLDISLRHLQRTADIIEKAEPVRAAALAVMHPDTQDAIGRKFGRQAARQLAEVVMQSAGTQWTPRGAVDRLTETMIGNVARAYTQINYASWGRQLGGLGPLSAVIPGRVFRAGIGKVLDSGVRSRMLEHPFFADRYGGAVHKRFSGVSDSVSSLSRETAAEVAASSWGAIKSGRVGRGLVRILPRTMESVRISNWFDGTNAAVAWAGYEAEVERLHPGWSAEKKQQWVGEQAEVAIRRSQNGYDPLDAGALLTSDASRNIVLRSFMSFRSDANKQLGIIYDEWQKGLGPGAAAAAKVAAGLVYGAALTAGDKALWIALASMAGVAAGDEERRDRALSAAAWRFGQDVAGFIPGFDLAVGLTQDALAGRQPSLDNPVLDATSQAVRAGVNIVRSGVESAVAFKEPDDEARQKKLGRALDRFLGGMYDAAYSGAALGGVPVPPLMSRARMAYRTLTAVPEGAEIESAVAKGDTEHAARLMAGYLKAKREEPGMTPGEALDALRRSGMSRAPRKKDDPAGRSEFLRKWYSAMEKASRAESEKKGAAVASR